MKEKENTKKRDGYYFSTLYQTYAQENDLYSEGKTERLIPIYEKRLELVESLLSRAPKEWADCVRNLCN